MGMHRQQRLRAIEDEQRFGALAMDDIAGGTAIRPLTIGGVTFKRGATLSREILTAMKPQSLRAMVVNHYLELTLNRERSPPCSIQS